MKKLGVGRNLLLAGLIGSISIAGSFNYAQTLPPLNPSYSMTPQEIIIDYQRKLQNQINQARNLFNEAISDRTLTFKEQDLVVDAYNSAFNIENMGKNYARDLNISADFSVPNEDIRLRNYLMGVENLPLLKNLLEKQGIYIYIEGLHLHND